MHVTVIEGRLDRVFFNTVERLVYLVLEKESEIHTLRVSDNSMFRVSIMLTKPGDYVIAHTRNGHVDKWVNRTMTQAAEDSCAAD